MFPSETTNVILFMLATAAEAVVGLYLLGYGAHCFLVVVEDTAAGNDQVEWPDVPIVDWIGKIGYLTWLVAFWAVPSWLLIGVIGPALMEQSGLPFIVFVVGALWLFFPLSLYSSLSAQSRWVVFRPEVLRRVGHHLPAMLLVYLVTGVLLIGWTCLAYYTLTSFLWLLPLTAALGPAVALIDARLLGRMAWLLNFRTPERRRPPKVKKIPPKERAVAVEDPWALPPELQTAPSPVDQKKPIRKPVMLPRQSEEDDFVDVEEADDADFLPVEGYGLAGDEPLPPPPTTRHLEDAETLGIQPEEDDRPGKEDSGKAVHPGTVVGEITAREAELVGPSPEPPPPARPLWSGVYQFPWYPQTAGAWLVLAVLTLATLALVKIQYETWWL
jgi:hypothetical protein